MHVAINGWFWNSEITGSGQYTRKLVAGLIDAIADLKVSLIVPKNRFSVRRSSISQVHLELVPGYYQPLSRLSKIWFEQVGFPRACARLGADIIHVPYWAPPFRASAPIVVTIHDIIPLILPRYRGGPLQRLYTALVSATARGAQMVLTDSETSRRDILSHLQLSPDRIRTIPLAVDDRYSPEARREDQAIRARHDLPLRYTLYLGGFDVRKNLTTVLAAYRWAGPAIGEECPLVIAGKLPEENTAFSPDPRHLMREEEVNDRFVRFIGFVDEADKPAVYRGSMAFIFPSRYEGFGLPPLEALSCGKPVVGSDTAALSELVGDAGILLPPDDAKGMAGALIQLAIDRDFHAEMTRRAVAQADRFSWDQTVQATLAAYSDAAS